MEIGVWIFAGDEYGQKNKFETNNADRIFVIKGFVSGADQEKRKIIIEKLGDWINQEKKNFPLNNENNRDIEKSIFKKLRDHKDILLPEEWGWDIKVRRDHSNGKISIKISLLRNGDFWCEVGYIEINLNPEKTKFSDLSNLYDLSLEQIWWTADARN
ncbi:hypothetical protein [Mycoplasma sp. ATU-Cv-508]|uniref:hypothetical protein n=1 Tax=Mycoplasma sp. ATU-Cv-508 TaxID=2048001 RepID=UPI000FDF562A